MKSKSALAKLIRFFRGVVLEKLGTDEVFM